MKLKIGQTTTIKNSPQYKHLTTSSQLIPKFIGQRGVCTRIDKASDHWHNADGYIYLIVITPTSKVWLHDSNIVSENRLPSWL